MTATPRIVVFYYGGRPLSDRRARYRVGGSGMLIEVYPLHDDGGRVVTGWRARSWYPDPARPQQRHRDTLLDGEYASPILALAGFAALHGYDEAYVGTAAGYTRIYPLPGRANETEKRRQ